MRTNAEGVYLNCQVNAEGVHLNCQVNAEGVRQFQPKVGASATTLGKPHPSKSTLKGLATHVPNPFRVAMIFF